MIWDVIVFKRHVGKGFSSKTHLSSLLNQSIIALFLLTPIFSCVFSKSMIDLWKTIFCPLLPKESPDLYKLKIESTLAAKKCHQHSKILDSLIKLHYMVRKYPRAISWTNSRLFDSSSWIDFPKQKEVLSTVPFFSPHLNGLQIKSILDSNLSFVEPKIFWKKSKVSGILLSNEDMSNLSLAFQKECICLHSQTWYPGMRSFKRKHEKKKEKIWLISASSSL